jgi:phage tail-like protein
MPSSDPFITFHFAVNISKLGDIGYFTEVSGLEMKINAAESRAAMASGKVALRKIATDSVEYSDIVLKRALTSEMAFWKWRELVEAGKIDDARCEGTIEMINMAGVTVASWDFVKGWPSKVSGPSLSSGGDGVAIEELTITHEGLVRTL